MTRSQQQNPRRAEGQPEAPQLVAVHALPGQERPLCVWAMRPFDALACEALAAADRALAQSGAGLAVKAPPVELHPSTS